MAGSRKNVVSKMALYVVLVVLLVPLASALDNGLALTPPMGWLTWQRFRCITDCQRYPNECISENLLKRTADLLVSEGYAKLGYNYVILDDCWLNSTRDADGNLQPDATRFPSGMLQLSKYIKSKGLKFGLYQDYGTKTCAGYPGILDHMKRDAIQFANWEVDYVKLDGCYADPLDMDDGYPLFGKYLNETGRPMVYSCEWPLYQSNDNLKPDYSAIASKCNLWRNYDDVQDSWESVLSIINHYKGIQEDIACVAGPGHWNDPDMLVIGNFGLSEDQAQAQMAIWALWSAPLIMSVDLAQIRPEFKAILQNELAISINQDPMGVQGVLVSESDGIQIWMKPMNPMINSETSYALAFLSTQDDGAPFLVSKTLAELNMTHEGGYALQNVFTGEKLIGHYTSGSVLEVRVNPTGVVFLKAVPV